MNGRREEHKKLDEFVVEMKKTLDRNSGKGRCGWRKKSLGELLGLSWGEKLELFSAVQTGRNIKGEAVDSALSDFFIWDLENQKEKRKVNV